ncbi:YdgH/BhsA/McbA-like domain containing protein, partial [Escherichia coli]
TVSVSGVASSPMDMREMLNKKAEEKTESTLNAATVVLIFMIFTST